MNTKPTRPAHPRRPSPTLLVSTIALVAALGGSAVALPGKGKVDKNDLGKSVVKSKNISADAVQAKHIGDGQIGGAEIGDGQIGGAEIGDGQIGGAEIANLPAPTPLTALGNGGGNDCIWQHLADLAPADGGIPGVNRASFYVDQLGIVHLSGVLGSVDGSGGDGACNANDADGDDRILLTLPPAARPETPEIQGGELGTLLIAPDEGVVGTATTVPPGGVFTFGGSSQISLDGITYRAAGS